MPARDRRRFLVIGAAVFAGATAGMVINDARGTGPALSGGRTPAPVPEPTPSAGSQIVAVRNRLADLLALGDAVGQDDLVRAHRAHLLAALSPSPVDRPVEDPDRPPELPDATVEVGTDPEGQLREAERAAAEEFAAAAEDAQAGTALFCAGLSAFCGTAVDLVGGGEVGVPGTGPMLVVDDVTALQQVVAQAHAAVFAYQRLLGRVDRNADEPIREALDRYRSLRDDLTAELVDRGSTAPAAEAAYAVPDDVEETGRLVEAGLLPYLGQWVQAATTDDDRRRAIGLLTGSTARAVAFGATLPAWPGWPD